MNLIAKLSNFFIYPTISNFRNVIDKSACIENANEVESHPFTVNIDVKRLNNIDFEVEFTFYDNVEKEIVCYQKMLIKKGEITENIGEGKLISYTEAKISDRGERLIYSTSVHFEEYTLFHERMAVKIAA
ncbi:MAG: hypothetical protein M0R46_00110 [Candidatus Muirbacterium halophilum]|nr:hypothetical protein [Candidatus Muirbacterium halophilum]MCK9474295.1 hypothetical protein [Candidatus Muirbacterium halophilum]